MDLSEQKRAAAAAALAWTEPRLTRDLIVGIGTGSTADHFIDLLAVHHARFAGAVASSRRSAERLAAAGVKVYDLDEVGELPFYVDGADEINDRLEMTKGGGGALTREKIVAAASGQFVCIVDASKRVEVLGRFAVADRGDPDGPLAVYRRLEALARDRGLARRRSHVRPGATASRS